MQFNVFSLYLYGTWKTVFTVFQYLHVQTFASEDVCVCGVGSTQACVTWLMFPAVAKVYASCLKQSIFQQGVLWLSVRWVGLSSYQTSSKFKTVFLIKSVFLQLFCSGFSFCLLKGFFQSKQPVARNNNHMQCQAKFLVMPLCITLTV